MRVTEDGIRKSAYRRWEQRGWAHGFDRQDWSAAERQVRFERNYRVVSADRLDGDAPRGVGSPNRRRCRFCSGSAPRAAFSDLVPVFPTDFGGGGPVAFDQCDECAAMFAEEIDPALLGFIASLGRQVAGSASIPVAAFKGLVKLALALMPPDDLDEHEETIDWIGNPDHDFDLKVLRDLACVVHSTPSPFPASWAALAKKTDEDEPWPSMLFFLGIGRVVLQVSVPLGRRDDEMEITSASPPDVLPPSPFGLDFDPISRVVLPIASAKLARKMPVNRLVA